MLQGNFKGVSRKSQGCFKKIEGGFDGVYMLFKGVQEVQWVFEESFKGDSRMFQGSFKVVSRKLRGVPREIQW